MPAAREIEVGALPPRGALAPMLSTLMMRPQRRSFICGQTSRVKRMRGEQLLVEVVLQDLVGQLLERAGRGGAGVVDDDVDLAERLHRLVVDALDVGGLGDVALHADDPAARLGADRLDRLVERLAAARHDRDVGAGGGEAGGDRKADALAAAGDDGRAAGKTDFHSMLSAVRVTTIATIRIKYLSTTVIQQLPVGDKQKSILRA